MRYVSDDLVRPILEKLESPFDAHEVERRLLRLEPIAFARELLTFEASADPLQQFSAAFARWLDQEFAGKIRQTKKVRSCNLGGEKSLNQQWEKIADAAE